SNDMLKKANQPLAVMFICMLAGYGYMSVFLRGKHGGIAAFAAVICYLMPATMDNIPPIYNLVGVILFVVCCVLAGANKSAKYRDRKSNAQAMAWMMSITLAVILILMCIVPREQYVPSGSFNAISGKYVFSLEDFRQYSENIINPQIDFGNGNGISAGSIGTIGSIQYNNEPFLLVRAPEGVGTIYLKAFQAAVYTKTQWYALDESIYKKYSGMFEKNRQTGFDPYMQVNDALEYLTAAGVEGINADSYDIGVKQYHGDDYSYVPMDTTQIDGNRAGKFTKEDREIHLSSDIPGNSDIYHTYTITQWQNNTDFERLITEGKAIEGVNQKRYSDFVYNNYLDANTSCADRIVEELFPRIMSGDYDVSTPEGKAAFIRDMVDFFDAEYSYTLRPGTTPSDKDFVENFLFETKKGFCTYFASAAVMIFRCAGIPARYVEGYVVPESLYKAASTENEDYYEAVVTDRYAHAWVEIYMDGIGWVVVDPTPGYSRYPGENAQGGSEKETQEETQKDTSEADTEQNDEESSETQSENQEEPSDITSQDDGENSGEVNTITGDKHGTGGLGEDDNSDGKTGEKNVIFNDILRRIIDMAAKAGKVLLAVIKIAAAPFAVILFLIFRQKYLEQKRVKLYNGDCSLDNRERVCRIMAYYERILKFEHIHLSENDSYAEIIAGQNHDSKALNIAQLVEKALYSDAVLDDDEMMQIMTYVYTYSQRTYFYLGLLKKLIFKYIFAY
ncbi:MAG: transglutaminase family protein, partial [Lachnospiraceae bacterium]